MIIANINSPTVLYYKSHARRDRSMTCSDQTVKRIDNWIRTCIGHESCSTKTSKVTFVPRRLIFVGTTDKPAIRIVTHKYNDLNSTKYIALTHRW
jgi:hypothetical protein